MSARTVRCPGAEGKAAGAIVMAAVDDLRNLWTWLKAAWPG
jgi:hypothetical protein